MPRYTGGCVCGAVRIEIDAVTVTGEPREYNSRSFCPTCGSSLFDRFGDEFELHAGCLDAPDQLTPTYETWVIRREAWLPPFDLAKHSSATAPAPAAASRSA